MKRKTKKLTGQKKPVTKVFEILQERQRYLEKLYLRHVRQGRSVIVTVRVEDRLWRAHDCKVMGGQVAFNFISEY